MFTDNTLKGTLGKDNEKKIFHLLRSYDDNEHLIDRFNAKSKSLLKVNILQRE